MAAGVTIDEAFIAVGCSGLGAMGTQPHDLQRGLRRLGMQVGEKRPWKRVGPNDTVPQFPRWAIVSVEDGKTSWGHWVLIKDGFVFDPGFGWPTPIRVYEDAFVARAYSRRYKRQRDARKRLKGRWGVIVPIYGWKKSKRRAKMKA